MVFWMLLLLMVLVKTVKKSIIMQRHGVGEFWCHKIDLNGILSGVGILEVQVMIALMMLLKH